MLMLPPALAVAGGLVMLYLAAGTPSALVVEDYARIEELTNERFARDREASRLGIAAEIRIERGAGRIVVAVSGNDEFDPADSLILALRHATDDASDIELVLPRRGAVYAAAADPASGRYLVELTDDARSWRLAAGARRLDGLIALVPQSPGGN